MQIDLWQRRAGWLGLVAVIMFSGLVAQTRLLADDDSDAKPAPVPKAEAEKKLKANEEAMKEAEAAKKMKVSDEAVRQKAYGEAMKQAESAKEKAREQMEKAQQEMEKVQNLFEKQGLLRYRPSPFGESGKYWIGVECHEASPELRAQLGLKDDEGLVVVHVAEDSPAAKAGLKQHDVIVAAGQGGTPHRLGSVPDLIEVMDKSEGKGVVPLKIVRGGKEQVLDVTPAERPDVTVRLIMKPGPGILYSGNVTKAPPLPDNVSVAIVRQGNRPAKITVSRGDEKWEISGGELDKLPEDLRPMVQGMVGGVPMTVTIGPGGMKADANNAYNKAIQLLTQQGPQPPKEGSAPPGPTKARPVDPEALMRRLDDLDRRLEELQQELHGPRDGGRDQMPRMRSPGQAEDDGNAPRPPKGARPMREEPRDSAPPPPTPRGL